MKNRLPLNEDYRDTIPFLVTLAETRGDLFDNPSQQRDFINLLEGCSSAEELKGILNFPAVARFIKNKIITFE